MPPKPAQSTSPSSPFNAEVISTHQRVGGMIAQHHYDLSIRHRPEPAVIKNRQSWKDNYKSQVKRRLQRLVDREDLLKQQVLMGDLEPIQGPLYASTLDGPRMDAAAVAGLLEKRPAAYVCANQKPNFLYFSPSPHWASPGIEREELRRFFCKNSFLDNKLICNMSSVYMYLLKREPEVADTFKFSPQTEDGHINLVPYLEPHSKRLVHFQGYCPEWCSTVFIQRGSQRVRVLLFVQPIPSEALTEIDKAFRDREELIELW